MTYLWSEITDMVWDRLKPALRSEDKEFSNILDELKSNFRPPKALQPIERVEPDSYDKLLKELIFDKKAGGNWTCLGFHAQTKTEEITLGWWFGTWLLFSISYMGCHPSHWRTHIFQDGWNYQPEEITQIFRHPSQDLREPLMVWYVTSPVFL